MIPYVCIVIACAVTYALARHSVKKSAEDTQKRLTAMSNLSLRLEDELESLRMELNEYQRAYADEYETVNDKVVRLETDYEHYGEMLNVLDKNLDDVREKVKDLERGLIPNYEAASKAVKAVNDFNAGLESILNYDPMDALKESRKIKEA